MRTVLVTRESWNGKSYRADAEGKHSFGGTVGKALDALTAQFENPEADTIFIVQRFVPDEYFTADQQRRMSELIQKVSDAEVGKAELSPEDRAELEALVEAELEGSARRVEKVAKLIG